MISLKILVGMTGTNRSNNDMNTRLQIKLVGVEDFQPLHWGIEIPGNIAVSGNISPLRRNMFSLRLLYEGGLGSGLYRLSENTVYSFS